MINIITDLKNIMIRRRRVDLAAGIVLAGAFRTAMTSLIHDVILPSVSTFATGNNIANLSFVLKKATGGMPPVVINYGRFFQATIDFLIIGMTVTMILRAAEKVAETTEKLEPKPSKEVKLLMEIRDLLNEQASGKSKSSC